MREIGRRRAMALLGGGAVLAAVVARPDGGRSAAWSGDVGAVLRHWAAGDLLEVTLPMRLAFHPAPDDPSVQAVSYGPVVLAGRGVGAGYATPDAAVDAADNAAPLDAVRHPARAGAAPPPPPPLPLLDAASVRPATAPPLTFAATADGRPVTLVPVARAQHEPFTVYWRTSQY